MSVQKLQKLDVTFASIVSKDNSEVNKAFSTIFVLAKIRLISFFCSSL